MSSKKAHQIKKSLTPAQLEITEKKRISGNYLPEKLIKLLKKLAIYDSHVDVLTKKLGNKSMVLFIVGPVLFLPLIIMGTSIGSPFLISIAITVPLILAATGAYFHFQRRKWEKHNLNDDIRDFLFPFIAIMREEILSGSKVYLEVDGRNPTDRTFFVEKIRKKKFYGRSYENYQQTWLKGRLTLADHTKLFFNSEKSVSMIKVTKRSRSGKTKVKHKEKMRETAHLKMLAPKSTYRLSGKNIPHITVSDTDGNIIIKAKYRYKAGSIKPMPVNDFLNTIHQMYSTLKPITS